MQVHHQKASQALKLAPNGVGMKKGQLKHRPVKNSQIYWKFIPWSKISSVFKIEWYILMTLVIINSSSPCATYMDQWTGSALVQVMARHRTSDKHYLNQFWIIVHWTLRNNKIWIKIFIFSFKKLCGKMSSAKWQRPISILIKEDENEENEANTITAASPTHQQSWYWLCKDDFNYLGLNSVEKWNWCRVGDKPLPETMMSQFISQGFKCMSVLIKKTQPDCHAELCHLICQPNSHLFSTLGNQVKWPYCCL